MNLLIDPVFSTDPPDAVTLPGLLAALARDEVRGFPRLRAHQRAAWHMFRVQLAALALDRGGRAAPSEEEDTWRDLLLGLTDGEAGPWDLVGADRTRPAFLQPADPSGLKWEGVPTPDALDLLITARNHDLKVAIAQDASPEDWALGLVSLQTSEGFGGRSNYGIARMNGGSSSRAFLGLAPADRAGQPDPSAWWRRDVGVLLRHRNAPSPLTPGGPALLWCEPWLEGAQIAAQDMDPWAIEVCRRVRLTYCGDRIRAERATSKAARVEAKAFAGVLGDPWAPVDITGKTPKALTLAEGRFDYRRMVRLLASGDYEVPLAAQLEDGEAAGDMVVVAEALSRGNSKTDGLKTRTIPVPKKVRGLLAGDRGRLSTAAQEQIEEIKAADAALREAVALYAAGGDRDSVGKAQRQRAGPARARLDARADRVFFEHLWMRVAALAARDDDAIAAARRAFREMLTEGARTEFAAAIAQLPLASIHAPRAETRARGRLEGLLRHHRIIEPEEEVHV